MRFGIHSADNPRSQAVFGGAAFMFRLSEPGRTRNVAIYTKYGKEIIKESVTVDRDCYVGNKVIKIRALVEGRNERQSLYVSDLLADNGKREIQDVIDANTNQ